MAEQQEPQIIWVDEQDNEIGQGGKLETHRAAQLHRAFSIFVVDRVTGKMLLQKRALGKYHSGGLWTNACCSHPRVGETWEQALIGRLAEELNYRKPISFGSDLRACGSFRYLADFGNLSEHEYDHVFLLCPEVGFAEGDFVPNPEEASELRWISIPDLRDWMEREPEAFTAWFPQALELAMIAMGTGSLPHISDPQKSHN